MSEEADASTEETATVSEEDTTSTEETAEDTSTGNSELNIFKNFFKNDRELIYIEINLLNPFQWVGVVCSEKPEGYNNVKMSAVLVPEDIPFKPSRLVFVGNSSMEPPSADSEEGVEEEATEEGAEGAEDEEEEQDPMEKMKQGFEEFGDKVKDAFKNLGEKMKAGFSSGEGEDEEETATETATETTTEETP